MARDLEDGLMSATGKVSTEFARLESSLAAAIQTVAGTKESAGRTPTHRLSFRGKVELFDDLCRQRKPDVADESLHGDMIKRLVQLGDRRDLLTRSTGDSGGEPSHAERLTATDLLALATETANAEGDLRSYLSTFRDVTDKLR